MDIEKYNEVKGLMSTIERLENRLAKLLEASSGTLNKVTVEYTTGGRRFSRPGELHLFRSENVKEIMKKEADAIENEIADLKEKFKSL